MSRDSELAAWKKEFAAENSYSLRTAQEYATNPKRAAGHAKWLEFCNRKKAQQAGITLPDLTQIDQLAGDIGSDPILRQEILCKKLWALFQAALSDCSKSLHTQNAANRARAVAVLQNAYNQAEKERSRLIIDQGAMIPASKVKQMWNDGVLPLIGEVRTLGDYLASKVSGFDRALITQEYQNWVNDKWNPRVNKLIEKFSDDHQPTPPVPH